MNKLRKAEAGEEEKEGDKEQDKNRRKKKKKTREKEKQGISDLELENSEIGCETQYERENQEKPGVAKGDTQKFQISGGKQVFSMFLWLVHTNQNLRKKGKKKKTISCDMLQNMGG